MSDFHGRFIWYELMTSDPAGAKAFYGDVVGWTSQDMPMSDMTYSIFEADGAGVGGLMALTADAKATGVPPNWTGYVAVDDTDAATGRATALGGSVIHASQDIPDIGRFAIIADPHGAVIAIMTPLPMDPPRPQAPRGTPGHTSWHELYAGELETDFAFYAALFGWRKDSDMDMGPMGVYRLFSNRDGQAGGMMTRPPTVPVPAWLYYFQVGDIDAAARRVTAGGGQVLTGPMEVPDGSWIIQGLDPQGAMFALVGRRIA
jgi:predicted enzyme related to lactoylglutathione lyase